MSNGNKIKVPEFKCKLDFSQFPNIESVERERLVAQDISIQRIEWQTRQIVETYNNQIDIEDDLERLTGEVKSLNRTITFVSSKPTRAALIAILLLFFGLAYPVYLSEVANSKIINIFSIKK
jgi:transposase